MLECYPMMDGPSISLGRLDGDVASEISGDRQAVPTWIATAARRRACRPTGSMRSSSSLSRLGTGFAGCPGLPGGRGANPF